MIQFKEKRLEIEYEHLRSENSKLFKIISAADVFSKSNLGKDIVITSLFRSEKENAALYANGKEPIWRPHTQWSAVDLRSSIYNEGEIKRICSFLNQIRVFDGKRLCASYHAIPGNAYHFHIQSDRG